MEIGSIGHAGPVHIMGISTELGIFSRTLLNFSKVLHTSIHAWEYPASLLNDNLVDPEIQNWAGKYLLGKQIHGCPLQFSASQPAATEASTPPLGTHTLLFPSNSSVGGFRQYTLQCQAPSGV